MELVRMEEQAIDDAALVRETLAGHQSSFQLLVERHEARVFALLRHYVKNPVELEDLAQETFLKAFKRLDSFEGQASFYTWIYRIAVNTALDHLKKKSRSPIASTDDPEVLADPQQVDARICAPHAALEREEIACATQAALAKLPEIFRTVLILREFEDMAYQDMADLLGISIGTIESRLYRARARFKAALLELHPEYGEFAEDE
jgi:RNA polymerase sigma-70 factor (ECF subfamily)